MAIDGTSFRRLALACLVSVGCADARAPDSSLSDAGLPAGHPAIPGESQPTVPAAGLVGVVLETMDAGGYTYARVAALEEEIWVAGPRSPVSLGDSVSLAGAIGMTDFVSNQLERSFDRILFLDAYRSPAPSATSPAAPTTTSGPRGVVLETMNAAGYTYVRVDVDGEAIWIAAPPTAVRVGDTVTWLGGATMRQFRSPSLDRTFDAIVFAGGLSVIP